MSQIVSKGHKGLETSEITGTGLLLHRHYLQNPIFQVGPQEKVNDIESLDGEHKQKIDIL